MRVRSSACPTAHYNCLTGSGINLRIELLLETHNTVRAGASRLVAARYNAGRDLEIASELTGHGLPLSSVKHTTVSPTSRALLSWGTAMEHYVGLDVSLKLTAIYIVDVTGKIEREGVVSSDSR
jgi:hypothetical protein